jgi:FKBP-type peptidyl-prolyl cis-trans isomerase FkpA
MKLRTILITLTILLTIGFFACRKNGVEPDIYAYDQQQIQAYIAANGITGMQKDTTGKSKGQDTTGIWYKIITPGNPNDTLGYADGVSYVYTQKSFDNKYVLTDTILDHFQGFLGHIAPKGLMLAMHNILKYNGGKMRVIIPSHIAYGVSGVGSGSSTVTNGRIAGNQCLDYTISTITDQSAYDQVVIHSYMTANSLNGYTQTADGLWYKITTAPTGTNHITINSSVTLNYTGTLLNGTVFDNTAAVNTTTFSDLSYLVAGFREGLLALGKQGGSISLLIPSGLGYGTVSTGSTGGSIPANSCLRFEVTVTNVIN